MRSRKKREVREANDVREAENASLLLSPPDKGGAGGVRERRKYLPYDKRLTILARQNRKTPTLAEHLIWTQVLSHRQFAKYKFHRQKPIGRYIADFYCAELKLVIEIDGHSHAEQADYDQQRTDFLNSLGLKVLRYTNGDVQHNLSSIFDDLARVIAP
jgi:very-short-patch-repair endonuclease